MDQKNYLDINRVSWNVRTGVHLKSDFYDVPGFLAGNNSLNNIELDLLGDISEKKILHLQCHFGQDTISLARMGAEVTGVDFSDAAIDVATQLAKQTNTNANFICCNIYDLPEILNEQFDIVFTSYGTIGWLPDLDKWANIIAAHLKQDGKLVFVEFHPVVWMFDSNFENITYNYFNTGAIVEKESGTYAEKNAAIHQEYITWNHSLSEVFKSLIANGFKIDNFDEYDFSPYNCFDKMVLIDNYKFRIEKLDNKIPMVYSIVATKNI